MAKKSRDKYRSAPSPRDELIKELRNKGYTYDAIAAELHRAGHTSHQISRVAVEKHVRRLAPHLTGPIKHKMKLDKLIRVRDLEEKVAE